MRSVESESESEANIINFNKRLIGSFFSRNKTHQIDYFLRQFVMLSENWGELS